MTVTLDGVTKTVAGETHLYGMSLSLVPNGLNVLLGPTTAGKTSILRLLAGLDRPTAGRVLVEGADRTTAGVRDRDVAMVYQQFINYPAFSVYDNIAAPLRRARLPGPEIDRRVRDTAALLHIDHLLDRLPGQLSGGQQQRTALARALVKRARLLLLDEPLVNLDYKLREELRTELRHIFQTGGATVVYATTEPQEALLLGGQAIVVDAGRVLQIGEMVDVYRNPASVRVGEVFSDPPINLIAGRIAGGEVQFGGEMRAGRPVHFAGLADGAYRFGVRAHHVDLAPAGPGAVSLSGTVELSEISGAETFVHVRHNGLNLVSHEEGVHSFRLGEPVTVYVDPDRLYAFDAADRLAASPHGPAGAAPVLAKTAGAGPA